MKNDPFLPEDYKEPVVSRYYKFEDGDNVFRVLPAKTGRDTLIMGWEYWNTVDGVRRPVRVTKDTQIDVSKLELDPNTGEMEIPKFFWAFAVWSYRNSNVQILELKQKGIRTSLLSLSRNPKWGSPTGYDITVTRVTEGGKTTYPSITPDPKEEIAKEILEKYEATPLDLTALYRGEDPFAVIDEAGSVFDQIAEGIEKSRTLDK